MAPRRKAVAATSTSNNKKPSPAVTAGAASKKKKAPPAAAAPPRKKTCTGLDNVIDTSAPSDPSAVAAMPSVAAAAATPTNSKLSASSSSSKRKSPPVDPDISLHGHDASEYAIVVAKLENGTSTFYDAVLNQCNISTNNNKYYRIQMLQHNVNTNGEYYVWHKWGRVGETGKKSASKWFGPFATEAKALPSFAKKYKDKTGNAFGAEPFVAKMGKYTPVEIDSNVQVDEDDFKSSPVAAAAARTKQVEYLPSTLDDTTKELVQVLFSDDMRDKALAAFNLDLNKLPLGVPSQSQIQRGVAILGEIEDKLKNGRSGQPGSSSESYDQLSSRFYTAIPHSFGRQRPPTIASMEALRNRYDMCNILLDMYSTNETIRKIAAGVQEAATQALPSPVDQHYKSLNADLTLLSKTTDEFAKIQTYYEMTKGEQGDEGSLAAGRGRRPSKLFNVWSVDRQGENQRFAKFDELDNRCLLWHGTNIAVVAPILTNGLRIMPHSGGRVGAGIYLACLQEKSAQYTSGYGTKFACMFLCEAPLGKQHLIDQDGPHAYNLRAAPPGFDSVRAVGEVQPTTWESIELDGKPVQVPQNKPSTQENVQSSFQHDEFLVYDEAQVRIRYVVTVQL